MQQRLAEALGGGSSARYPVAFLDDWPSWPKPGQLQPADTEPSLDLERPELGELVRKWRLQVLLASHRLGIPSLALAHTYRQMFNRELNFQEWGFEDLSGMIAQLSDVIAVQEPDQSTATLFPKYPHDRVLHDRRYYHDFDSYRRRGSQLSAAQPSLDPDRLISEASLNRDDELPGDVVLPGEHYHELILPMKSAQIPGTYGVFQATIAAAANLEHVYINIKSDSLERVNRLSAEVVHYFGSSKYPTEMYSVPDEFIYPGFPCLVYNRDLNSFERASIKKRSRAKQPAAGKMAASNGSPMAHQHQCGQPEGAQQATICCQAPGQATLASGGGNNNNNNNDRAQADGSSRQVASSKVLVEMVDFGCELVVDCIDLFLMPRKFFEIPRQGLLVSLMGLKPADGTDKWPVSAGRRLRCFSHNSYWIDCLLLEPSSSSSSSSSSAPPQPQLQPPQQPQPAPQSQDQAKHNQQESSDLLLSSSCYSSGSSAASSYSSSSAVSSGYSDAEDNGSGGGGGAGSRLTSFPLGERTLSGAGAVGHLDGHTLASLDGEKRKQELRRRHKRLGKARPQFEMIACDRNDPEFDLYLDEILLMETYAIADPKARERTEALKEQLKPALKAIPRPRNPFM